MKNDKELLKELLEYFDGVMDDVVEGKPFEKREIPDYRGHELEFKIDLVIDYLHDMMNTLLDYENFFQTYPKGTDDGVCYPNIKESLKEYEKYMSTNKQINEYFDEI